MEGSEIANAALLKELVAALIENGALSHGEVAGALLRAEWLAEVADQVRFEDREVMSGAPRFARLKTDEWQDRFGLQPHLFALRLALGSQPQANRHKIAPKQVRALFEEERESLVWREHVSWLTPDRPS